MSAAAPIVPMLIGGKAVVAETSEFTPVHNPSTGEVIARTPVGGGPEVAAAVIAAASAYEAWRRTPPSKRASIMFRYRELLEREFESLAALVTRENGKTLDEARGDVRRGIEVVEYACGIAQLLKGEALPQVAEHIDSQTTREPIGVCAGITPFNFPAMVPMWMFPLAIACGNSFVLKPSEKVPLTAIRLGELLTEAGLPEGVFNVVHGGRDVVDAICQHEGIAAISFVGSSAVAKHVYELGCSHGKRVQAAGGAKNVLVVMPDADPEPTLRALVGSAFGCAGQRCMAGSLLLGVGEAANGIRDRLAAEIDRLVIDDTTKNPCAGMGPVIDRAAKERVEGWIERTAPHAHLVADGRSRGPDGGFFVGPTLFDGVTPDQAMAREELFGPVLAMLRPQTLDEAIAWTHASGYGNGASIFTTSGASARQFVREIPCGMIGVNVGVPAPMALFSFSGWRKSFYGDLHVQGMEGVLFYTRQKTVLSRWDVTYERQHGW